MGGEWVVSQRSYDCLLVGLQAGRKLGISIL